MPAKKAGTAQQRKIAWILGAGASRGAGAKAKIRNATVPIPVQAEFWKTVLSMAQRNDRKIVEDFLFRYFRRYARLPPHISSQRKLKEISGVNVEEVFTFLSERIAAPSTNTNVRDEFDGIIWPALVRTVAYTFSKFNANAETKRHYRRFQKGLLRSHDSIVSFNYDTVAENSLTKAWHYAGINGPGGYRSINRMDLLIGASIRPEQ